MVKRRERGSVIQRGGAWRVRVSAGTDPVTGRRLWLCGTAATRPDAERLRTRFLSQVDDRKASRTRVSLGALLDECASDQRAADILDAKLPQRPPIAGD